MPTDTQRAATLARCIEREREAAGRVRDWFAGVTGPAPLEQLDVDLDRARAATDEAVRAVEELARAVLDMDTWGIACSNFDPALRLTDIETLNRLRHLASKVIPAAQATTTGGASDE